MSSFTGLGKEGMPFCFPNPHAPWERGADENTNGLIRPYCPKPVDKDSFDASHFHAFIDYMLNLK